MMRTAKTCGIIVSLFIFTTACHADSTQENIAKVKQDSLKNFIYLQGGTFTMGDFGTEKNGQYQRFGFSNDTTPHQVHLTGYSLLRNKVTWFEYDTYLLANNLPVQKMMGIGSLSIEKTWGDYRKPYQQNLEYEENTELPNIYYFNKPAQVLWQDAKDYCQWLGQQLNLPVDLVTEAQWEYAARSGGYKVLYANAQGDIHNPPKTRNINSEPKTIRSSFDTVSVGTRSTPNAAGFYDMDNNGFEWVKDWYSATYYTDYPEITNPLGPETGTHKVIRATGAVTFDRNKSIPLRFYTFRCAVNNDKPVQ